MAGESDHISTPGMASNTPCAVQPCCLSSCPTLATTPAHHPKLSTWMGGGEWLLVEGPGWPCMLCSWCCGAVSVPRDRDGRHRRVRWLHRRQLCRWLQGRHRGRRHAVRQEADAGGIHTAQVDGPERHCTLCSRRCSIVSVPRDRDSRRRRARWLHRRLLCRRLQGRRRRWLCHERRWQTHELICVGAWARARS